MFIHIAQKLSVTNGLTMDTGLIFHFIAAAGRQGGDGYLYITRIIHYILCRYQRRLHRYSVGIRQLYPDHQKSIFEQI